MPRSLSIDRVLRPALFALLAGACATATAADTLPALVVPGSSPNLSLDETDQRILPVWNNASGRVEALLLLDPDGRNLSPLDRLLPTQPAPGLGVRATLDDGSRVRSALQIDPDAGLALLCNGSVGLAASLGTLGQNCLLASLADGDVMLHGTSPGLRFESGWQSPEGAVDLSFGLSWLDTSVTESIDKAGLWAGATPLAGLVGAQLEARQLDLGASFQLAPQRRLLFGGSLGSHQFVPAGTGTPLRWDSATVTFGIGYGGITGQLTGRLVELPDQNTSWSGLDLGVTWRTPWRAELSVGARNLLGSGKNDTSKWPLTELPAMDDPAARVPYVRYTQDL